MHRTADLPDDDRAPARDAGIAPGALIGRFVVRARLGEGGMGVVFAAEDPDLQRPVAIKLVSPEVDRPALRARLLREAQAMARLDHPNVVRVFEVGEHDGRLFVAMELVDGDTLARWLAAGPRPWREIVAMFRQVGVGLAAIHREGLVHRDVKPDNVLVDRGGRARVADLGLVRVEPERDAAVSPVLAATLTRTGVAMGTPGYMAPEQQRGDRVDALADQYSFCVALRDALRAAHPAPPRAFRAVLSRGLAFEPAERFPSMEALLAALERAATARRRRIAIGGGLTLASGGVAAAIVVALGAAGPAAPQLAALPADAGEPVVTAEVPLDASVAPDAGIADAAAPPTRAAAAPPAAAPRDAGPTLRPPPPLVPRPGAPDAGAPVLRDRIDPAHLAAVRAGIRDLGYRGFDLAQLDADLDAEEAGTRARRDELIAERGKDDLMVAIADAFLGLIARRKGECGAAEGHWKRALRGLRAGEPRDPDRKTRFLWAGRVHLGRALCRLEAGDLAGARKPLKDAIQIGWGGGDEIELADRDVAQGIWYHEAGDRDGARAILQNIPYRGDERANRAVAIWAEGIGLDPE